MDLFKGNSYMTYLHTTHEDRCKSIMKIGFFVTNYLGNVTDQVTPAGFSYWYNYRDGYGDYVVIIQIPKEHENSGKFIEPKNTKKYNKALDKLRKQFIIDDDDEDFTEDYDFLIPPKYIRGYYYKKNYCAPGSYIIEKDKFFPNPKFNPES